MDILGLWKKCRMLPGGRLLFARWIRYAIPYSGSILPEVLELEPGYAHVRIRDRRLLRNHLSSIHAAALMNFAELTSGLAFVAGWPQGVRGIVTSFHIEYLKKARGTLEAECRAPQVKAEESAQYVVEVELKDAQKDIVARARAEWRVGPRS